LEQSVEPVSPADSARALKAKQEHPEEKPQVNYFQVIQKKRHKNTASQTILVGKKALDIMTKNVISIKTGATMDHAWRLMKKYRISYLPVVWPNGKLAGLLSARGLLYANMENRRETSPHDSVEKMMITNVFQEKPDANAMQIVMDLVNKKVGVVLVTDNAKKPVGIITSRDVLKVFFLPKNPLNIMA
jgi:CBS domain-containing protein